MELAKIEGLNIQYHQKSKRIINIELEDSIIEKLAFNFKKFDILTLEYKPFSRFTIANALDEITSKKLSKFIIEILKDRKTGCLIISPKNNSKIYHTKYKTNANKSPQEPKNVTKMKPQ